jgi:hypothetical protein
MGSWPCLFKMSSELCSCSWLKTGDQVYFRDRDIFVVERIKVVLILSADTPELMNHRN